MVWTMCSLEDLEAKVLREASSFLDGHLLSARFATSLQILLHYASFYFCSFCFSQSNQIFVNKTSVHISME